MSKSINMWLILASFGLGSLAQGCGIETIQGAEEGIEYDGENVDSEKDKNGSSNFSKRITLKKPAGVGSVYGMPSVMSSDGSVIVALTPTSTKGIAAVYTKSGSTYSATTFIPKSELQGTTFANTAISGNGARIAVVETLEAFGALASQTKFTVFTRGSQGLQGFVASRLPIPPQATAQFGRSIALSADGNRIVVGDTGNAYYYQLSNGVYSLSNVNRQGAGGDFGRVVAISDDGLKYAVSNGSSNALAMLYSAVGRSNRAGTKVKANITGSLEYLTLALSGNGNVLLLSVQDDEGSKVLVFKDNKVEQSIEAGTDDIGLDPLGFGYSLDINSDGSAFIVGNIAGVADSQSSAFIYRFGPLNGGARVYFKSKKLSATATASSRGFGTSVNISGDGKVALVGTDGSDKTYLYR